MATADASKGSGGTIKQWVSRIISFSSQYDNNNWAASCVVGEPKVYPRYGDLSGSWASQSIDTNQYIELGFKEKVFVCEIDIYETMNAGGIKNISVRSPQGRWESVWSMPQVQVIQASRVFSPPIKDVSYKTDAVRLEIDCTACGTWVEIDAVQLIGRKFDIAPSPSMQVLADDLSKIVNQSEYSDVTFDVGGTLVYGHRNIMSARSSYFRALFEDMNKNKNQDVKNTIPVVDVSIDSFCGVLFYLYTNHVYDSYTSCQLIDVWRAADFYILDGLKAVVVETVVTRMNTDDVVAVYQKACKDLPVIEEIREACLDYISTNMAAVSLTDTFKNISRDLMLEIVQLCTAKMSL
ncbi:TD and POZ domain-containing protein 3-like [Gigantopelta aegis]|uniref:TD and POZ domain-containing protein 3-like n=1 Tax=Gigantopelta aegis TaxID=1735272 RepID=UPI001B88A12C|nr:TD and POZ domain-containing protein 3-like [Gigantopelta aegis]